MNTRRIGGVILTWWGAALLVKRVVGGAPEGTSGAYRSGQELAMVFAVVILIAGLWLLYTEWQKARARSAPSLPQQFESDTPERPREADKGGSIPPPGLR
jgi:hypothetical protein